MRLRHREFLRRGGAGDHLGPHNYAEFHRGETDAARGTEDRQGLAGLEPRAIPQGVERGAIGDGEAGGLLVAHRIGDGSEMPGAHRDALGAGAVGAVDDDAVADPETLDALPEGLDDTDRFAAGRERQIGLHLVAPCDDERIEEVQCRQRHPHHGLAGSGHWIRQVGDREILGAAEPGAEQSLHADPPLSRSAFCLSALAPIGGSSASIRRQRRS